MSLRLLATNACSIAFFCCVVRWCTGRHYGHQERGGRGSRLVLCTDGLANVGLGALDDLKTVEEREIAETFYEELGREVRKLDCVAFP